MRTPSMDKNGLKKGAWSPEEDQKLIEYIQRYRIWNWTLMPKFAGLSRTGKSCRLRWMNYLNPQIKRGNITKEEEDIIKTMYTKLGKRWSAIGRRLPGRTDNEIKNYWHTHLKKHFKEAQLSKGMDLRHNVVEDDDENTIEFKMMSELDSPCEASNVESSINIPSDSYLFSGEYSSSISTSSIEVNDYNVFDEMSGNEDLYSVWSQSLTNENLGMRNEVSYIQGWLNEPSSPYSLYNNDYFFGQLLGGDTDGITWNLSI